MTCCISNTYSLCTNEEVCIIIRLANLHEILLLLILLLLVHVCHSFIHVFIYICLYLLKLATNSLTLTINPPTHDSFDVFPLSLILFCKMSCREQNAEEEEFHSTDSECLPYMHVQGLFFSSFFERRERGEKR